MKAKIKLFAKRRQDESMQKKMINNIQALRGLACLMIVFCHTAVGNGIGQYGVEIFLIISGFIIMYTTEFESSQFWRKRIKKIVPLYWLVTLFTSFAVYAVPQLFNSYEVSLEYIFKSLFFIPYEHGGIRQPVLGLGWTLNYEMLFYLIFWAAMKINYEKRGMIASIICIIMILVGIGVELPMPFAYWFSPFLLEFCYGIGIYYIWKKCNKVFQVHFKGSVAGQTMCICFLIAAGYLCMELSGTNSVHRAFDTGIIGMVIVLLVVIMEGKVYIPKILLSVAAWSYLIYLTHIYVVRLTEALAGRHLNHNVIIVAMDILFSVLAAYLYTICKKKFIFLWKNRKNFNERKCL